MGPYRPRSLDFSGASSYLSFILPVVMAVLVYMFPFRRFLTNNKQVAAKEVERARAMWIERVRKLDVDGVVSLYRSSTSDDNKETSEGRLLGTVDTKDTALRQNKEQIRDYFVSFLDREWIEPIFPKDVSDQDLVQLGNGTVAYHGYYDFLWSTNGKKQRAHAKFTYIYGRNTTTGELDIICHTSGLTPEGVKDES
eukprot:TRINITY_DN19694_c0_g1_i1.p1 TRINITY_DN19694_c0_g1~~TRINITY_DN19694_c0_g1_i1.p1  ORF type:complete len:196 (+),score=13.01 TRINITY_DN19694_c0_g1_i1:107-694(+)